MSGDGASPLQLGKKKLTVQEVILIFDSTGRRVCARVHLCAQA